MDKNDKNNIQEKNLIYEEGEMLFPISNKTDEFYFKIENWAEMFYHLKEGKSKQRFIKLIKSSEYSHFLEGLNYEYGINNCPKDLKKAFQIYKNAANYSTDSMSMFRMYYIYKKDFNKFNIPKRSRILERFYLFKCFSFARYSIIKRTQNLCNRFDIFQELVIYFEEDENLVIFNKFIDFLNKNFQFYDINPQDLIIISGVINYDLNINEEEKNNSIQKLIDLAEKDNLEAFYKITCFIEKTDKEAAEQYFQILFDREYFRSYVDYALLLNKNKKYEEALEVLRIARKNGVIAAGYIYYDIYLDDIDDFSDIINEAKSSSLYLDSILYNLINILIDDILTESIYSFFEFIFLRKLCFKNGLEKFFNYHFLDYTKEIADFLIKITKEENTDKKKKMIENYYYREDYFQELHLACGILYFYGINKYLKIDNSKSLNKILIASNNSNSDSYKRFCYYYIYRIRKRLFKEKKGTVDEKLIKYTEKDLFKKYHSSLNNETNLDNLSSSYFYYLSRLFHKKIGNNGDKILEFMCLNKASEYRNDTPGSGSIISFYRKYKSKILKEKYKEEIKKVFNKIKAIDAEGYGDDGTICPICYTNKRNTISLPCKHLFCNDCLSKIDKCPICRRSILMKYQSS